MRDKAYSILVFSLCLLSGGAVAYIFAKYLLPLLLPFIIAALVVGITRRGAESLAARLRIPKGIVRLVASLTLVFVAALVLGTLIWQSIAALVRLLTDVGESNGIFRLLEQMLTGNSPLWSTILPEGLAHTLGSSLQSFLSSALSAVGGAATRLVSALPTTFLFLLVTAISIIYFALDYDKICAFLSSLMTPRAKGRIQKIRDSLILVVGKYIRSYALILLITYFVIFLGLTVLRVKHGPILALLIAFLDILPVIGVGTVLLPWSLISFALGDRFLGVGLLLLFVINAVLRQFIEPKILGKSLNLHPLVTLGAIYLGYAIFGFSGLLLLPLIAVGISLVLKNNSSAEVDESTVG